MAGVAAAAGAGAASGAAAAEKESMPAAGAARLPGTTREDEAGAGTPRELATGAGAAVLPPELKLKANPVPRLETGAASVEGGRGAGLLAMLGVKRLVLVPAPELLVTVAVEREVKGLLSIVETEGPADEEAGVAGVTDRRGA